MFQEHSGNPPVPGFSLVLKFEIPVVFTDNILLIFVLKELRYDNLSLFIDGLNHGSSVGKPKNYSYVWKKNSKRETLKQKGTRMAKDGED